MLFPRFASEPSLSLWDVHGIRLSNHLMPKQTRLSSSFWGTLQRILQITGLLLLIVGGLAAFYFLSLLTGPSEDFLGLMSDVEQEETIDYAKADELLAKSRILEEEFDQIIKVRRANDEDLASLSEAIELQKEAIKWRGGADSPGRQRLEDLTEVLHNHSSTPLALASEESEIEGWRAEQDEEFETALEKFRRAYRLQNEINEKFPEADAVNVRRLASLQRKVETLEARVPYKRSEALETEAEILIREERFAEARRKLQQALDIQRQINLDFRGVVYADIARLGRLETRLASLDSSDVAEQIRAHRREAEAFEEAGRYLEASEQYQFARRLQERLNKDHPRSEFASTRLVSELADSAQAARSFGSAREILNDIEILDNALLRREIPAALQIVQQASQKIHVFKQTFPSSELISEELVTRLDFLNHIRNDIAFYQEKIYANSLPIPDHPGVLMFSTEIPQALFVNILLTNPSRNRSDALPVDSLTWNEARDFAKRVEWLLATPVRLPRREEFESAVGSLRYVDLNTIAWHNANSEATTQSVGSMQPNSNGFHDLLGNVAEWLEPSGLLTESESFIAGGDAKQSIDRLADVPIEITNRRSRNINVGFRIVIETGKQPTFARRETTTEPVAEEN